MEPVRKDAAVWVLVSPKGPHASVTTNGNGTVSLGTSGRKLGHRECALEGDIGTPTHFSISFPASQPPRGKQTPLPYTCTMTDALPLAPKQ